MKKCPYCGKEYSDEATVCAVDQTALVSVTPFQVSTDSPLDQKVLPSDAKTRVENTITDPKREVVIGIVWCLASALLTVLCIFVTYSVWDIDHDRGQGILNSEGRSAKALQQQGFDVAPMEANPSSPSNQNPGSGQTSVHSYWIIVWLILFGLGGIFKGIAKMMNGFNAMKPNRSDLEKTRVPSS